MSQKKAEGALLEMEFPAEVWLACERLPLSTLLDLQAGQILTLSKDPEEAVDLVINGLPVASGELVVVDGKFGLRVTGTKENEVSEVAKTEE